MTDDDCSGDWERKKSSGVKLAQNKGRRVVKGGGGVRNPFLRFIQMCM